MSGFYFGFGFFWGLVAALGCIALIALFIAVVIGGLADRHQRD